MTNEQIDVAIAEACGWTCVTMEHGRLRGNPCGLASARGCVPDYCNNLNAMEIAEVSRLTTWVEKGMFAIGIINETLGEGYVGQIETVQLFEILHATAHQRAKAFLQTIGKWID